ncbi:transmembrane protein, putative [Medicago truncatula]|uniref:Transmembrane protein, putative n=1 Tax=Medicago truncatula TaxID=3880 RepID=G7JGQ0_MEDTR|nr:transmembrane protein, putative [Medicago truncatula]
MVKEKILMEIEYEILIKSLNVYRLLLAKHNPINIFLKLEMDLEDKSGCKCAIFYLPSASTIYSRYSLGISYIIEGLIFLTHVLFVIAWSVHHEPVHILMEMGALSSIKVFEGFKSLLMSHDGRYIFGFHGSIGAQSIFMLEFLLGSNFARKHVSDVEFMRKLGLVGRQKEIPPPPPPELADAPQQEAPF